MSSKEAITKAAIDVIKEEGIDQYSLSKVAERAKITKAAIFYHFKNKEELTRSLISFTIEAYNTTLKEEYDKALAERSSVPYTKSYIQGNLRQLNDDTLVGLHGALLTTVISGNIDAKDWDEIYQADFKKMQPEVGSVMAELVRYALDGMWHAKILGITENNNAENEKVALLLQQIISQDT